MLDAPTDTYFLAGILAGILLRFLVRDPEAGYCLVEALVAPGAGPPPNRHPADNEAFYVLEGSFEFLVGATTLKAEAGGFVRIPLGEVHTFRNVGEAPGRILIMNAPGTLHVNFFSQAGEAMPAGTRDLPHPLPPTDVPRLIEAAQRHGMEFILPQG